MLRSSLRRISLLLVLAFTALASADLVCAWPCLIDDRSSENARSAVSHSCHPAAADSSIPKIAGSVAPCGMEHAETPLMAERVAGRSSLKPDTTAVIASDFLMTPRASRVDILTVDRTITASLDPPGFLAPLRI